MIPLADSLDRIAPTRRPAGRAVMRQRWAELLFLHWSVPPGTIQALLPPGLTVDTYEGRAYVGLVPFTMTGVRPTLLPPFPPLSNFHETNVRTYVHHQGRDPGVWFFSLDAANASAARLARAWFKLPYFFARMRVEVKRPHQETDFTWNRPTRARVMNVPESRYNAEAGRWGTVFGDTAPLPNIAYQSERLRPEPTPARCAVRGFPQGASNAAVPGTLEHFLVERYILYAYACGRLYQGRVHHPPYPLQTADVDALDENLIAAAGIVRPEDPPLVHFAREVNVEVFSLQRVA